MMKHEINIGITTNLTVKGSPRLDYSYIEAVDTASKPLHLDVSVILIHDLKTSINLLDLCDGLILSGGPDIPPHLYGEGRHIMTMPRPEDRAIRDLAVFDKAESMGIPILGICAGMQTINIARGGSLYQHIPDFDDTIDHMSEDHVVFLGKNGSNHIASALGLSTKVTVNSSHHQAVCELGDDLKIVAMSKDGVVEGIQSTNKDQWVVGVQWHPERLVSKRYHRKLFVSFLQQVRKAVDND